MVIGHAERQVKERGNVWGDGEQQYAEMKGAGNRIELH